MSAAQLAALLGDVDGSAVSRAFDFMGIAEEEITRAKKGTRFKDRRDRIHATFGALMPGSLVLLAHDVYRHHCRELLARAAKGHDLREGTEAEVLEMLMKTSLRAPLNQQGQALYERLFKSIFGKLPEDWTPTAPPWPHADSEMLAEAKRKIARDR